VSGVRSASGASYRVFIKNCSFPSVHNWGGNIAH
jgi:hypothetical protein